MDKNKIKKFIEDLQAMAAGLDEIEAGDEKNLISNTDNGVSSISDSEGTTISDCFVTTLSNGTTVNYGDTFSLSGGSYFTVLVDFEQLLNISNMQLSSLSNCVLHLFGRTRAAHPKYSIYTYSSNILVCECTTTHNKYDIDLLYLYKKYGSASFKFVADWSGGESIVWNGIDWNGSIWGNVTIGNNLTEISVTTAPTKRSYYVGDSFNNSGMVVTGIYADGSSNEIDSNNYTVTPSSGLVISDKYVTIESNGLKTKQAIDVSRQKIDIKYEVQVRSRGSIEKDWSEWTMAVGVKNIYVYGSETKEYRTILKIDKSLIGLGKYKKRGLRLMMHQKIGASGNLSVNHIKINNSRVAVLSNYAFLFAYIGDVKAGETGDLEVVFEYDDCNLEYYLGDITSSTYPVLMFCRETDPATQFENKNIEMAAGSLNLELATGKAQYECVDIAANSLPLGIKISHVLSLYDEGLSYGNNFRLNLCERLELDAINTNYYVKSHIYTDELGEKNSFNIQYYYISNGKRVYLTSTEEVGKITINNSEQLMYGNHLVYTEQVTINNLIYLETPPQYVLDNTYYKEVLSNAENLTLPVSWLKSDVLVKGFNKDGNLVLIADPFGNYIAIKYNTEDKITQVCDGYGNYVNFSYNPNGMLEYLIDSAKNKEKYTYSAGRLQTITYSKTEDDNITDLDYKTITFGYTSIVDNGLPVYALETVKTSDNLSSKISYEKGTVNSRITSVYQYAINDDDLSGAETEAQLSLLIITYDYENNQIILTDEYDNQVVYRYSEDNRLEGYYEVKNGLVSNAKIYDYSEYASYTEKKAQPAILNLNSLTNFTFKCGEVLETKLNNFNQPTNTSNQEVRINENAYKNITIDYTYDEAHRQIKTSSTEEYFDSVTNTLKFINYITTNYVYDTNGMLVKTIVHKSHDENGTEVKEKADITEYVYDDKGSNTKQINYIVSWNGHTSDENCNCSASSTTNKFYTQYVYDSNRRVVSEFDETGLYSNEFQYYTGTNLIKTVSGSGLSNINYAYDSESRVIQMSAAVSGVENANYTEYSLGEISQLNHSGDDEINFLYDVKRRICAIYFGENLYEQFTYEEKVVDGNNEIDRITKINANDETFVVEKDRAGKYLNSYYNGTLLLTKNYRKDGILESITDHSSNRNISITSDVYGNTLSFSEGSGSNLYNEVYSYTVKGQREKIICSGIIERTDEFVYSGEVNDKVTELSTDVYRVLPSVDNFGRYIGKTIYINSNQVYKETVTYRKEGDHATNMPVQIKYTDADSSSSLVQKYFSYTYDEQGNIATISQSGVIIVNYSYDKLGRLIREDNRDLNKTYVYAYDENGNILSKTKYDYTTDTLSGKGTSTYYDYANGKLVMCGAKTYEYDNLGNPIKLNGKEATWTRGRKLASYNYNIFNYDAQGRRIKKNGITFYYDSQDRLIKQSNGLEFYYDDRNEVIGFSYGGSYYVYRKDIFGNIIAVLDSDGNCVVTYSYDAWGNFTEFILSDDTALAQINPFRYRGYYYDTETGFYYLKTRYYDPATGRFINMDGIEYADPETINGLNLYAYCNNNPVMNIDPDGHFWFTFLTTVIGAVVGAAVETISYLTSGEEVDWNGIGKSAIKGAVSGGTFGFIFGISKGTALVAASYVSEAAGAIAGEIYDYASGNKQLTTENVGNSILSVIDETVIDGTINYVIGNAVLKVVPSLKTNPGWFIPKKFASYFTKSYGQKVMGQLAMSGVFTYAYNLLYGLMIETVNG